MSAAAAAGQAGSRRLAASALVLAGIRQRAESATGQDGTDVGVDIKPLLVS